MYYVFSFLNPATLKGKLKYSIKTDILLTHAGHASSLMVGPIIQPEVGPIWWPIVVIQNIGKKTYTN